MSDEQGLNEPYRPLFVIKGDATPEEVAALTVVLQAVAAASVEPSPSKPRSEWAHPRRAVRRPVFPGRDGWRASALPR